MKIAKSVNRLGTEAVYNIFAKTKKLIKQGKEIIDLSLGQHYCLIVRDICFRNSSLSVPGQYLPNALPALLSPTGWVRARGTP